MLQIVNRNSNTFDAVVVGSGAAGGWAAKQLTEAGLRAAVLEAGPTVTPAEFSEPLQPCDVKYRGHRLDILRERPVQGLIYARRESNHKWFANDIENPYTTAGGKPIHWIRMRVLGGRTLSWGRQGYRLSDLDIKAASHDGNGDDLPISHGELVPYYEKVGKYIGIGGQAEGLKQLPDSVFLPPMGMSCRRRGDLA